MTERIDTLDKAVEFCEANPVRSKHHDFKGDQQRAYDILPARGRRLYDNLRTQFDLKHSTAFEQAFNKYGLSKTLYLDY